jgi:hypothetical protein
MPREGPAARLLRVIGAPAQAGDDGVDRLTLDAGRAIRTLMGDDAADADREALLDGDDALGVAEGLATRRSRGRAGRR